MHKQLLAAVAAIGLAWPAQAADLGGSCCKDLEERVAELEAAAARKGNRKMSLIVYGQVNMAYLSLSLDDENIYDQIGDNGVSESRFGMRGRARINPDWSAGYRIEVEVGVNRFTLDGGGISQGETLQLRRANVWLGNKAIGRFTLGRSNDSSYGVGEIDLSNASVAARRLSLEPLGSRFLNGVEPNDLPFRGGQANIIRYDSPRFAGFTVSAHWGEDDAWGVALRYAGEFGQIRVAAGAGYRDVTIEGIGAESQTYQVSGSLMHTPSGVFVGGSWGRFEGDLVFQVNGLPAFGVADIDVEGWHINGGVEAKLVSVGPTTLFAEYGELDISGADVSPSLWGIGVVQAVNPAAMHFYATYRQISPDIGDVDIDQFMVGARVRF